MTIETVIRILMASPLLFGLAGLLLGLISTSPYTGSLVWMGVCFGAFVGACASLGCLFSERLKLSNIVILCVNAGIFIVVGREFLIL